MGWRTVIWARPVTLLLHPLHQVDPLPPAAVPAQVRTPRV